MNKRQFRYFLLACTVIVWGLIGRLLINKKSNPIDREDVIVAGVTEISEEVPDTFSLIANYSDPFLSGDEIYESDTIITDTTMPVNHTLPKQKERAIPDVSFIKYFGMIANPQERLKCAVLLINGNEYLIREKDSASGVVLKKVDKSRITISYKGEKQIIEKEMK